MSSIQAAECAVHRFFAGCDGWRPRWVALKQPLTSDWKWPVSDTRRADLNVRSRGVAAAGSAMLNGSKGPNGDCRRSARVRPKSGRSWSPRNRPVSRHLSLKPITATSDFCAREQRRRAPASRQRPSLRMLADPSSDHLAARNGRAWPPRMLTPPASVGRAFLHRIHPVLLDGARRAFGG
jgi:hypothetical protein